MQCNNHIQGCFFPPNMQRVFHFCTRRNTAQDSSSCLFLWSSPKNSQFQEKGKYVKRFFTFSHLFPCFQEENRGLRLKEELVVAAEKLQQPSAMAAYPEEENLRYIFWRDPQSEQTPKNQSKRKKQMQS